MKIRGGRGEQIVWDPSMGLLYDSAQHTEDKNHMNHCLFCNCEESNYRPGKDIELICSQCVILLADATQADLNNAYQKALDKGYLRKASALESFIIPEGKDEQRKPESKKRGRYLDRTGIVKSVRNQKERIKRVTV